MTSRLPPPEALPPGAATADTDIGCLIFDRHTLRVWADEHCLATFGRARLQYVLFETIARHGPSLDRAELFERVWELPYRQPDSDNSLSVTMHRLRRRIGDQVVIVTREDGGYHLLPALPVRVVVTH